MDSPSSWQTRADNPHCASSPSWARNYAAELDPSACLKTHGRVSADATGHGFRKNPKPWRLLPLLGSGPFSNQLDEGMTEQNRDDDDEDVGYRPQRPDPPPRPA